MHQPDKTETKTESLKNVQNSKIGNVAGSVWLNLFLKNIKNDTNILYYITGIL
jgi:hypothetical protein